MALNVGERAVQLGELHPDWSIRMIITAVAHGEDSPEFADAKAQADSFAARFAATDGWMVFP